MLRTHQYNVRYGSKAAAGSRTAGMGGKRTLGSSAPDVRQAPKSAIVDQLPAARKRTFCLDLHFRYG